MSRTYSAQSMITLPSTTALTLYALTQEVIDAAKAQKLQLEAQDQSFPQSLLPSLERLTSAQSNLGLALQPSNTTKSPTTREADSTLDNAWGSLHDFLMAWLKIDSAICPDPEGVQAVFDLIFSEGKGFLALDYTSEWVESDRRLAALKQKPYIDTMQVLGGLRIVEGLEQAHSNYGEVLGITTQASDEESKTMGFLSVELRHKLREFIVKAVAYEDISVPGSTELSEALRLPVETWKGPSTGSSADSDESQVEGELPEGNAQLVA